MGLLRSRATLRGVILRVIQFDHPFSEGLGMSIRGRLGDTGGVARAGGAKLRAQRRLLFEEREGRQERDSVSGPRARTGKGDWLLVPLPETSPGAGTGWRCS